MDYSEVREQFNDVAFTTATPFTDDGSVRLRAHYELEPTEYDQDHIDGIGMDIGEGVTAVQEVLDTEGLTYDRYENLPAGGES